MKKLIFILTVMFFSVDVFANNSNSNFELAKTTPRGAFTIHAENVVRGGKSVDLDIILSTTNPNTYKEANQVVNSCFAKAPVEQYPEVRYQNLNYAMPPSGYENGSVIGWANVVNYGTGTGYVLVRKLAIWQINQNGTRTLVTNKLTDHGTAWGYSLPKSSWQIPEAWAIQNNNSLFQVLNGNIVKIPTSNQPLDVFHFWNTVWPRSAIKPGMKYELEAEVRPVGAGMIQVGIDYWTATNGGVNIEAANSPWICAQKDSNWITVRAGAFNQ